MITVRQFDGVAGSGKTTKILDEVSHAAGKYLIVMPRTELIDETASKLRTTLAQKGKKSVTVISLHGENKLFGRSPVASQIEELPSKYSFSSHVIVFITHESLMDSNMQAYNGWHIYIDEVPNAVKSTSIRVPVVASYLHDIIDLTQIGNSKWSFAELKLNAPPQSDIQADVCLRSLSELFRRMRSPTVVCLETTNLSSLSGATESLRTFCYWDLSRLDMFKTITVSGAGFDDCILFRAMGKYIQCKKVPMPARRLKYPKITISYFAEQHLSSTYTWRNAHGKKWIEAVAHHLSSLPTGTYYWSANEQIEPVLRKELKGRYVRPKQEGTNSLIAYETTVFLYSAKSQRGPDSALREITGISDEQIRTAREDEDIKQFVMRGRLRDSSYGGDYAIYVYDKRQAEMLRDYFTRHAIGTVDVLAVQQAGILTVTTPSSVKKPQKQTTKQRQTKSQRTASNTLSQQRRRAKSNAINIANGMAPRPRGRPKKVAGAKRTRSKSSPRKTP